MVSAWYGCCCRMTAVTVLYNGASRNYLTPLSLPRQSASPKLLDTFPELARTLIPSILGAKYPSSVTIVKSLDGKTTDHHDNMKRPRKELLLTVRGHIRYSHIPDCHSYSSSFSSPTAPHLTPGCSLRCSPRRSWRSSSLGPFASHDLSLFQHGH